MSYARAQADVRMLTGIVVSAKTQQRLGQGYDFPTPPVQTPLQEACVDGGKVRLRKPLGEPSIWRDYKAIDTDAGMVANFQNNAALIDWVNAQPLATPLTCLGDGHDGVWNIVAQIATPAQRRASLDWYHLNENLQKVGGSNKRLRQAEAFLWHGNVGEAMALFAPLQRKQAQNFCQYLEEHRHRIVNYAYYCKFSQSSGSCPLLVIRKMSRGKNPALLNWLKSIALPISRDRLVQTSGASAF